MSLCRKGEMDIDCALCGNLDACQQIDPAGVAPGANIVRAAIEAKGKTARLTVLHEVAHFAHNARRRPVERAVGGY